MNPLAALLAALMMMLTPAAIAPAPTPTKTPSPAPTAATPTKTPTSSPSTPKPSATATPTPTPAVTSTPTAAAPSGPCATAATLPKAGGGNWTCTFSDEFNGSALDQTKWYADKTEGNGYHVGAECMVGNDPDNIKVASGALNLTVRKEAAPFTCKTPGGGSYASQHTGASVHTLFSFAQTQGRWEIRAAFPSTKVKGVHGALWMWPKDQVAYGAYPMTGEIDIAEYYSSYPDRAIPFIHYGNYDATVTNNYCTMVDPSKFHDYVMEWTSKKITVTIDGVTCLDHTLKSANGLAAPKPFDKPFFTVLTQALGVGGNTHDANTTLPATTKVDYVRVYK